MTRGLRFSLLFGCALLAGGCTAFVNVISFGPSQPAQTQNQVRLYHHDDLTGLRYTRLSPVEATSCQPLWWDAPPSEQDAIGQLRAKASSLKANGITNLTCQSGPSGLVRSCWASLVCKADAIRVPEMRASAP